MRLAGTVLAALLLTTAAPVQAAPAAEAKARALVAAMLDEVFNRGKLAAIDRYFAPAFVDHTPWPGEPTTLAGFKAGMATLRRTFPDLAIVPEAWVVAGDTVVVRGRMTGTFKGGMPSLATIGRKVDVPGMDMLRVQGGQIVEHWGYADERLMREQLGP